jgi:hypothetical protein
MSFNRQFFSRLSIQSVDHSSGEAPSIAEQTLQAQREKCVNVHFLPDPCNNAPAHRNLQRARTPPLALCIASLTGASTADRRRRGYFVAGTDETRRYVHEEDGVTQTIRNG